MRKSFANVMPPSTLAVPYRSSRKFGAPKLALAPVFMRLLRLSYQWTAMAPSWSMAAVGMTAKLCPGPWSTRPNVKDCPLSEDRAMTTSASSPLAKASFGSSLATT